MNGPPRFRGLLTAEMILLHPGAMGTEESALAAQRDSVGKQSVNIQLVTGSNKDKTVGNRRNHKLHRRTCLIPSRRHVTIIKFGGEIHRVKGSQCGGAPALVIVRLQYPQYPGWSYPWLKRMVCLPGSRC